MSTPRELYDACEGYFDKLNDQAQLHRLNAYFNHASFSGKKAMSYEKFCKCWPIGVDTTDAKSLLPTKEEYNNMIKKYGLKLTLKE